IDLLVGIALGDLVHHGGRALAVAEGAHLRGDVVARHAGERRQDLAVAAAVGAVADGARGGELPWTVLGLRLQRGASQYQENEPSHETSPRGRNVTSAHQKEKAPKGLCLCRI